MKAITNTCLGFDVQVLVPETVEEFDQNAKRPGACLDEATSNILYRSWNPVFRSKMHDLIEAQTSIKRKAELDEDGDIKKYLETEAAYLTRVCAELKTDPNSKFGQLARETAATIPFDASAAAKTGIGKTIAKAYLNSAATLLQNNGKELDGKLVNVDAIINALMGLNPGAEAVERDPANNLPTQQSLAKLIAINEARKRAEAQAKLQSDLVNLVTG